MPVDLMETVLTSTSYDEVTQPVFSAAALFAETFKQTTPPTCEYVPAFVFKAFDDAVASKHLVVKRFVFLVLLKVVPAVSSYAVESSQDPARTIKFLGWLGDELEKMFRGEYAQFDEDMLGEFVSAATIAHAS